MSIVVSLKKLYVGLCDVAALSSNAVANIVESNFDDFEACTVSDVITDKVLSMVPDNSRDIIDCTISDKHDDVIHFNILRQEITDDESMMNILKNNLSAQGMDIEQMLLNTSNSSDTYAQLGAITNLFSESTKISRAQVQSHIDSIPNLDSNSRIKLKSIVNSISDSEDKISQLSWLTALQDIFGTLSTKTEQATLKMNESNTFEITSIWSIVTKTLSTLLSGVLQALGLIFGGIIAVISTILSSLMSLVSAFKQSVSDFTIENQIGNCHLKGSLFSRALSIRSGTNILYNSTSEYMSAFSKGNNAMMMTLPGLDFYAFNDASKMYVNGILSLNVHPGRLHSYIASKVSYTPKHGNTEVLCSINSPLWPLDDPDIFLHDDELGRLYTDISFADQCCFAALAAIGLSAFIEQGSIQIKDNLTLSSYTKFYDIPALTLLYGYYSNYNILKQSDKTALFRSMYNTVHSNFNELTLSYWSTEEIETVTTVNASDLSTLFSTNEQMGYGISKWYSNLLHMDYFSNIDRLDIGYNNVGQFTQICVDKIPTLYDFSPAEFSQEAFVATMIGLAAVAVAMFVGGNIALRAIRKKSSIKQYNRQNQLAQIREQYTKNPTTENADALYKAAKSYNFKAKLLGWDSYDVMNGWYNEAESSTKNQDVEYYMTKYIGTL